jgi:hypothetical protein
MSSKFYIVGLFYVFIVLSGLWLSNSGKPLNTIILTIHKLISVAAVVYLGITIYRIHQVAPLSPVEIAATVVTFLFFVAMIATGGLLSAAKTMPAVVLRVHQIVPFLVIFSSSATLYSITGQ